MTTRHCTSTHVRYVDRDVINYGKALVRAMKWGALSDLWPAFRRLVQAVERLEAEDKRERERAER